MGLLSRIVAWRRPDIEAEEEERDARVEEAGARAETFEQAMEERAQQIARSYREAEEVLRQRGHGG